MKKPWNNVRTENPKRTGLKKFSPNKYNKFVIVSKIGAPNIKKWTIRGLLATFVAHHCSKSVLLVPPTISYSLCGIGPPSLCGTGMEEFEKLNSSSCDEIGIGSSSEKLISLALLRNTVPNKNTNPTDNNKTAIYTD